MRVDKRRANANASAKGVLKTAEKAARIQRTPATMSALYSAMDLAVKRHLVAKRHASRIKSRIAKMGKK